MNFKNYITLLHSLHFSFVFCFLCTNKLMSAVISVASLIFTHQPLSDFVVQSKQLPCHTFKFYIFLGLFHITFNKYL